MSLRALVSDRSLLLILLAALAARLFFFALIIDSKGDRGFLEGPDSGEYVTMAENVLRFETFSTDSAEHRAALGAAAPRPDNFRPPLYPLFLAAFFGLGLGVKSVALAQIALLILAIFIFARWAEPIFGRTPVLSSAFFLAMWPYDAYLANLAGQEPLFLVFAIPGITALARYVHSGFGRWLAASALLLGLATLVRSATLAVLILLPLAVWLGARSDEPRRRTMRRLGMALAIICLVLLPWVVRNRIALSTWIYSTDGGYTLALNSMKFFWREYLAGQENVFENDGEGSRFVAQLRSADPNLRSFANARALGARAFETLAEHPVSYAAFHLMRAPALFVDEGAVGMLNAFGFRIEQPDASLRTALIRLFSFDAEPLRRYGTTMFYAPASLAGPLGASLRLGIMLLAALEIALSWRGEARRPMLFLGAVFFLYAAMLPLYGLHRHRMMIDPFLLALAVSLFARLTGLGGERRMESI